MLQENGPTPEGRPLSQPEIITMITCNDAVAVFRDLTRLLDLAALIAVDGDVTEMNLTLAKLGEAAHRACPSGPVTAAFTVLITELRALV